jgi:hypothetical protein
MAYTRKLNRIESIDRMDNGSITIYVTTPYGERTHMTYYWYPIKEAKKQARHHDFDRGQVISIGQCPPPGIKNLYTRKS